MPVPYSDSTIRLDRFGDVVTASGIISVTSNLSNVTNQKVNETVPDGFRPVFSGTIMMTGNNGQVWNIRCQSDGECYLSGSASIGYMYSVLGVWVVS